MPTKSADTGRLQVPAEPSDTKKAPTAKRAPVRKSAAAAEPSAAKKQATQKQATQKPATKKSVNEPVTSRPDAVQAQPQPKVLPAPAPVVKSAQPAAPTVAAARGGSPSSQTSRGRHGKALLIAAAVITLVSAGAVIWFGGSTTEMTMQPAPETEPQQTFDASVAPASPGNYIRTRLTPNGRLSSDQFIVSDEPVQDLSLQLRPMTAYREVAPEVQRLEVFADGWEVDVDGGQLAGSAPSSIPLGDPTTVIHLRYVTDGVTVPSSPSSSGRALVLANPLVAKVDAPQQPAVVRLAGTEVLSLSCVRGERLPQPCGRPDDTGWRVQMDPADGSSGVLAQVNLPTA